MSIPAQPLRAHVSVHILLLLLLLLLTHHCCLEHRWQAVAHVPDAPELVAERDAVCAMGKELAEAQAHLTNGEFALAKKCFVALDSRMSASCIPKLGLAEAEIGMDNASQALRHTLAVRRGGARHECRVSFLLHVKYLGSACGPETGFKRLPP